MTTAELIERLRGLDPEGKRIVSLWMEPLSCQCGFAQADLTEAYLATAHTIVLEGAPGSCSEKPEVRHGEQEPVAG